MSRLNKTLLFLNIFIVLAIVFVLAARAWTNPTANPPGGNGALYYSSGNVGIGTSTPQAILDVYNGGGSGSTAMFTPLIIESGGSSNETTPGYGIALDFYGKNDTGARSNFGRIAAVSDITNGGGGGNASAALAFYTMKNTVLTGEKMRIDANGNVGINTTSPGAKLDVNGNIQVSGGNKIIADNGGSLNFGTNTNGNRTLTIGGFGDGISFSQNFSMAAGTKIATGNGNDRYIKFSDGPSGPNDTPSTLFGGTQGSDSGNPVFRFWDNTGYDTVRSFGVGSGSTYSEKFTILDNGKVGIGVTGPSYMLQVGSSCTVTGTNACVDFAELFPATEAVDYGDIVMVDVASSTAVKKATADSKDLVLGAVTTDPAIVIEGSSVGVMGGGYKLNPLKPAIALAGRVPVKVSIESGPIKAGDRITVSSLPGVGMKATKAGRVVGIALQSYDRDGIGKILIFVNPQTWIPENLLDKLNLDK